MASRATSNFAHDLRMCADAGLLGSIDANRGDPQNGWDTDQFPLDLYDAVHGMMIVLENGGLHSGGLNFDAKVRRESTDLEDLFIAHIGGMDTFARGLLIAERVLADPRIATNVPPTGREAHGEVALRPVPEFRSRRRQTLRGRRTRPERVA